MKGLPSAFHVLVIFFVFHLITAKPDVLCDGDGDCSRDEVCVGGVCSSCLTLGQGGCVNDTQCQGYNLQCIGSVCNCPDQFDGKDCRFTGKCNLEQDCGVWYRCENEKCIRIPDKKKLREPGRNSLIAVGVFALGGLVALIGILYTERKRNDDDRRSNYSKGNDT